MLKITQEEFTQIAVLAGTDYNQNTDRQCDLHQALHVREATGAGENGILRMDRRHGRADYWLWSTLNSCFD